jgi:hypothetical protein
MRYLLETNKSYLKCSLRGLAMDLDKSYPFETITGDEPIKKYRHSSIKNRYPDSWNKTTHNYVVPEYRIAFLDTIENLIISNINCVNSTTRSPSYC